MKLAIIGGTGLQTIEGARLLSEHSVETPYGVSSATIKEIELGEASILFLSRHGSEQQIPPHKINYRANIKALHQLQVSHILAVTAVGGISFDYAVGDLVIPDQIIDYTWGRESTFFDGSNIDGKHGNKRRHIDFTYPYTEALRQRLFESKDEIDRSVHLGGVYGCTQGPRLETAAEVHKLRKDGVSVVGMTGMPEACLARELDIAYASLSLIVNAAAGINQAELSEEEIEHECQAASNDIKLLLRRTIDALYR